ncbi:uncharacterized protein [Procambarus clarkii]|uniref:uncharacterized protein n=1 Tax=Procambarus clarkii TaxID=6728 RepID=UPI001E673375|nr:uncharacterized protein LOC123771835 [Procambarus clarkii]
MTFLNMMILVPFLLVVSTAAHTKTVTTLSEAATTSPSSASSISHSINTLLANKLLSQVLEKVSAMNVDAEMLAASLFRRLVGGDDGDDALEKVKSLLVKQLPDFEEMSNVVTDSLGVDKDFLKPFVKIVSRMSKLSNGKPSQFKSRFQSVLELVGQYINLNDKDEETGNVTPEDISKAVNGSTSGSVRDPMMNIFDLAKELLESKFGNLSSVIVPPDSQMPTEAPSLNLASSSVWMIVKSTWHRILAFVGEENSLESFMQLTPVKIIDRILGLGDEVSLVNFLAKKLDADFAQFLAEELNPYLGPLRDFESFYNFTRENKLNGIIDYFRSDKFRYTVNAMSRFISAYLEDAVSDDVMNQYIEFISFNNTDLHHFYKSILRNEGKTVDTQNSDSTITNSTQRYKRDVLQDIANSYKPGGDSEQIFDDDSTTSSGRQIQRYGVVSATNTALYDPARDGYGGSGYGGGGYGGYGMNMNTLDPYVVLGSLALGTILGFLLFRALRGTRRGRRDIGDGSLSLWQSDIPDGLLPWGTSAERVKREAPNFNKTGVEEFNLPNSMRGDIWSTNPLVEDDLLATQLEEEDIADHLNHLWRVYKHDNETTCVEAHLCDVMTTSTAERLTGKDSSMALLMASIGNLMGVVGSGQLMDKVTNSLVLGELFTCPTSTTTTTCHHHLL